MVTGIIAKIEIVDPSSEYELACYVHLHTNVLVRAQILFFLQTPRYVNKLVA